MATVKQKTYTTGARSEGWARIGLLIMESEKRQDERVDRVLKAVRDDLEPRLRAVESAQAANVAEHREVRDRLDAQKDLMVELKTGQESIKDAMIVGRLIAMVSKLFRGKP